MRINLREGVDGSNDEIQIGKLVEAIFAEEKLCGYL